MMQKLLASPRLRTPHGALCPRTAHSAVSARRHAHTVPPAPTRRFRCVRAPANPHSVPTPTRPHNALAPTRRATRGVLPPTRSLVPSHPRAAPPHGVLTPTRSQGAPAPTRRFRCVRASANPHSVPTPARPHNALATAPPRTHRCPRTRPCHKYLCPACAASTCHHFCPARVARAYEHTHIHP